MKKTQVIKAAKAHKERWLSSFRNKDAVYADVISFLEGSMNDTMAASIHTEDEVVSYCRGLGKSGRKDR